MFCVIQGHETDGLAKLVRNDGASYLVEYFDFPAQDGRVQREVPKSAVILRRLGRNTRVYIYSEPDNRWRVARVTEDDGGGLYVRYAHKEDGYIAYADAFVRWKHPIDNPIIYLSRFITETPQYAEARSQFLKNYVDQRGAAFGIQALLSSSVELEAHQIDVVRRVLNDPSQRYLLADEVGLGKTIEAGIIIRQAVLDNPMHRIVILVPAALVRQWRRELLGRFGMKVFLDQSVFVLAHAAGTEQAAALKGATMVVVDEAHHVADAKGGAATQRLYALVQRASRSAERLLLLSATPIVRNEAGFLRMLHLLDPVVYPLEDFERFRIKIEHRQALAEVVAMLSPENALFLDQALDDVLTRIPNDARLHDLVNELKNLLLAMPEEEEPDLVAGIRRLRAHISETYRLNRRILRNRRKLVQGLTPDRSGVVCLTVKESPMARVESALENWRIAASSAFGAGTSTPADVGAFYWELATACIENPAVLPQMCARRQALPAWPGGATEGRFDGEDDLLKRIAVSCDHTRWLDARCARLIERLRLLPPKTKAVVFCSTVDTADAVFARLKTGRVNVMRHGVELEGDADLDAAESWAAFLTDPEVGAIVCDRAAEEGLNLQGGDKAVIHFDLPFQPNRIEQRMGRVDRYGAGNQIRSYVFVDEGALLQQAWFNGLEEGWGVFERSISSLQYLVEEELVRLKGFLFTSGAEALQELTARIAGPQGIASAELKLIDQQDALDELALQSEDETNSLFDVDGDWRTIRHAMLYWIVDTLLFSAVPVSTVKTTAVEQPVRLHYHPPESKGTATLIPLGGFLNDFLGAIDYDAPGSRASEPRSFPHMAHRTMAVNRGVRLLRYGDEFVEAVKIFSDLDDRGRSFALWRQVHEGLAPGEFKMCFRFDFLIEVALDKSEAVLASHLGIGRMATRAVLSRRGDALLAPIIMQVWLDEEGDEVAPEAVERLLAPQYNKVGSDGYIDKNLGAEHFRALKRHAPHALGNWQERCLRMSARAHALVLARPELEALKRAALTRARAEDDVRHAQMRTRIRSLAGAEAQAESAGFELEQRLNEALYEGIINPLVKVDVAGVVFLAEQPVSVLDALMGSGR
ncbi:ATP-dependent helicase HepA [Janthinobacterium lividum]|uniref:protein DpdE n=1 Tax=Janthinobacterium lividum TaxID=29581 RepID=UPI003D2174DC